MPPKKDTAATGSSDAIAGFDARETRFLAAAFLASTGAKVKIDFEVMGSYTGHTKGSANTMWSAVKRKAAELQPSWGPLVGLAGDSDAAKVPSKPKGNASKKRKAADEDGANANNDAAGASGAEETGKKAPAKATKGKGRPKKKTESEDAADEDNINADGADQHVSKKKKAAPMNKAKKDDAEEE